MLPINPAGAGSPSNSETAERMAADATACAGFATDMDAYQLATQSDPPTADWVNAYETLAFTLSDHAFDAAKDGEVHESLSGLASVVAGMADELSDSNGTSTQQQLTFRNAVTQAGNACGQEYTFVDGPVDAPVEGAVDCPPPTVCPATEP